MHMTDLQGLLKQAGLYAGPIDGINGPKTTAGMVKALDGRGRDWPMPRQQIGAAQVLLNKFGHEAGAVDGLMGHNTRNALAAWRHKARTGKNLSVRRTAAKSYAPVGNLPRQSEVDRFYGRPGGEIKARLVSKVLPFPMRLDWALSQTATKITLHRLVIGRYLGALEATRDHYGLDTLRGLGIDRYAGGYNHRKMRGGSRWSMHAYGIAVDHYAAPNGLRTRCPEALFCGAEYRPFLDAMEAAGMLPAIRLWGADAMHFQAARMG
jgi:hypothetical protein